MDKGGMMATQVTTGYYFSSVLQLGKLYYTGARATKSLSFIIDLPTDSSSTVGFKKIAQARTYINTQAEVVGLIDENGELWSSQTPTGRDDVSFAKFSPSLVDNKKFIDIQGTSNKTSYNRDGMIALAEDGSLYYWGYLGSNIDPVDDNNVVSYSKYIKKISIDPIPNAKKLYYGTSDSATQRNSVFVIDEDGNVWSWGHYNVIGRATPSGSNENRIPAIVDFGGKKIVKMSIAVYGDSLALDEDGNVWRLKWRNASSTDVETFQLIIENDPNDKVIDIASTSGISYSENGQILVYESGKVEVWGAMSKSGTYFYPEFDAIIKNDPAQRIELPMPEPIESAEILSFNGYKYWAYFVGKSGRAYSLGYNRQNRLSSRLGNGVSGAVNNPVPTEVVGLPLENLFTITVKNEQGEDIPGVSTDVIRVETGETESAQIGENYVLGHGTFEVGLYDIPEEYYSIDSKYLEVDTQGKEYNIDFVLQKRQEDFKGSITVASNVDNTSFTGNKGIVFVNGVAEITEPGNYEITAEAEGYITQKKTVEITEEEPNVSVDFELEKIPDPEPEPDQEDDYWLSNQPYFNRENLNIGEAK